MWAAWHVLAAEPGAARRRAGGRALRARPERPQRRLRHRHGALPAPLAERFGAAPARALGRRGGGRPCGRSAPGARPRASTPGTGPAASSSSPPRPAQDGVGAAAVGRRRGGRARRRRRCGRAWTRRSCAAASFVRTAGNVHPARLAFGLRERLLGRGAADPRGHPGARAAGGAGGGVAVETAGGGRVRARAAIVAVNAASGAMPPLRDRLTVVLEPHRLHGAGAGRRRGAGLDGRRVGDRRARAPALHAHDAATGGSSSAGRAGGWRRARAPAGAWRSTTRSPRRRGATCCASSPQLEGRRIGPRLGRSDRRLPHAPARRGRACPGLPAWAAVRLHGQRRRAPPTCCGRILALLALDRRDAVTRLPFVDAPLPRIPPEPLRVAGRGGDPARARAQGGRRGGRRAGRSGDARRGAAARADGPAHRALTAARRPAASAAPPMRVLALADRPPGFDPAVARGAAPGRRGALPRRPRRGVDRAA